MRCLKSCTAGSHSCDRWGEPRCNLGHASTRQAPEEFRTLHGRVTEFETGACTNAPDSQLGDIARKTTLLRASCGSASVALQRRDQRVFVQERLRNIGIDAEALHARVGSSWLK